MGTESEHHDESGGNGRSLLPVCPECGTRSEGVYAPKPTVWGRALLVCFALAGLIGWVNLTQFLIPEGEPEARTMAVECGWITLYLVLAWGLWRASGWCFALRFRRRSRGGRCAACGYDLRIG